VRYWDVAGDEWVLGIDVGTSRSAGAMANGSVTPLEVEGNRWMPSMVLLDPDGTLVVGSAADYQAGVYPDRVERTPKRHLGGPAPLLLGGTPVEVPAAIASLISVFLGEGRLRHGGQAPSATVLTHPVRWGDDRKAALVESARLAGITDPLLIEEPVAAAVHYVGNRVDVGQYVGVYDLGGGTFDTAVLLRTEGGFETVGAPGGDEFTGGEHFDHLVYEFLGTCLADEDPALWEQVQHGEDRKWTRAGADLLTQARRAKEAVSSYPSTQVLLPLVDRDAVVTRAQVEEMIRPLIEETVDEMATTIASAGLVPDDLTAVYLVGGSSRIPLVTRLMTERFSDRIATRDEPKSVVALGAAQVGRQRHRLPSPPVSRAGPTGGPSPNTVPAEVTPLREAWRVDLRADVHGMVPGSGSVQVTAGDGRLHQVGADGRWRWSTALPGPAFGASALAGGMVVVGCSSHHVVGIDGISGREQVRSATRGPVLAGPLVAGDAVVVADDSGTVSGFGVRDGVLRWMLPIGTNVRAPMAVTGSAVLVAGLDGKVYRVDATTGAVAWAFPAPTAVTAGPLVQPDTAFLACTDGVVYAIDPQTGRARWGTRVQGPVDGTGELWGRFVLVADRAGWVTALDRTDGVEAWRVHTGGTNPTGLLLAGSVAYVDGGQGELAAVHLAKRAVVGRARVAAGAWQRPVLLGSTVIARSGTQLVALHAVPG